MLREELRLIMAASNFHILSAKLYGMRYRNLVDLLTCLLLGFIVLWKASIVSA